MKGDHMEATTPRDFFEKILPEKFNPDKAADVDVIVQISITGANGGDWIITIKDKKLDVKEGVYPSPNLALKMAEKDYLDLVNGKISAEKAFFTGKVQFKGNIALALKLREAGFL
ncbi:MAG: SCP2 sterol-binding domain-containing protein [Candidatus Bathyarchaeota archaeon]|nr:SCP2 sterol-binding domain-containing protein [Candidatus Bathyarchaeota archaeon]